MGLGKTIQAHRCGRNSSAAFWRLESPGGLPDLPQVPVAKRDHAFLGRQGENAARVISGGRAQRQKDYTLDISARSRITRSLQPDLDLIAAWAPELVIVDEASG